MYGMTRNVWLIGLIMILFAGCTRDMESAERLKTGIWRAVIEIQGQELPFNFETVRDSLGGYDIFLINAQERLLLDEVRVFSSDSIDITLHVFDASINGKIDGDSIHGLFIKNYEKDYKIPFRAMFGQGFRFEKGPASATIVDFGGKYEVTFFNAADTTRAVGVFHQRGDSVTGTFLTPTGDYRFLQGNVSDGKLQLSTFDGNHSYLFYATKLEEEKITGEYYSGKTWKQKWIGVKKGDPVLPPSESITSLRKGVDKLEFSFPNLRGELVSLDDARFRNKVVILQLTGSWCPNCMDETKFLSSWYRANRHRAVEILALAYERKDDFEYARARVTKMKEKLDVPYDFVIAGTSDKTKASLTLPQLNQVAAFPTTIFVGRDGKVKKIHTGFSGPGTGEYYERFIEEFNETVNELLNENM